MSSLADNRRTETPTSVGVLLAILVCLPVAGILLIAQVLPQLQAEFRAVPNVEMLSAITLTIPALMVAVFSWPAGWLADRFGRKNLLLVGLVLYAAFGMSPLLLAELPAILAARALMGLAEGIVIITSTALIGDFFAGKQREKFLSLQVFLSSLSAVIFAVLGGVLGEHGWRTPFWVYAISLILIIPVAVMIREPKGDVQPRPAAVPGDATALPPFPLRLVLSIAAISLIASIAFFAPQIEVPFRLNEVGVLSPQSIGLVSGLANLGIMAGTVAFVFTARQGPKRLLIVSFALSAIGLYLFAVAGDIAAICVGAVVACLGGGIALPTLLNWAMQPLIFEHRGRGTGIWQASLWIGQFLTPILVVALSGPGKPIAVTIMEFAAVCALMAIGFVIFGPRRGAVAEDVAVGVR